MTGAGGDGGPLGIFLFVLQKQHMQTHTNHYILSKVKHSVVRSGHTDGDRQTDNIRWQYSAQYKCVHVCQSYYKKSVWVFV